MRLHTKFNLMLLAVFAGSLAGTGWFSYNLLQKNARDEVIHNAGIMMEASMSVRGYTVKQVKPLLEMQLRRAFLPQSVPAYAPPRSSTGCAVTTRNTPIRKPP
jgi:protein-histidine pros-kinase